MKDENWLSLDDAEEEYFLVYERLEGLFNDGRIEFKSVTIGQKQVVLLSDADLKKFFFPRTISKSERAQKILNNLGMSLLGAVTYDVAKRLWDRIDLADTHNEDVPTVPPIPIQADKDKKCRIPNLKKHREQAGLGIEDLATLTGISKQSLFLLEEKDGQIAERAAKLIVAVLDHPKFLGGFWTPPRIVCSN